MQAAWLSVRALVLQSGSPKVSPDPNLLLDLFLVVPRSTSRTCLQNSQLVRLWPVVMFISIIGFYQASVFVGHHVNYGMS